MGTNGSWRFDDDDEDDVPGGADAAHRAHPANPVHPAHPAHPAPAGDAGPEAARPGVTEPGVTGPDRVEPTEVLSAAPLNPARRRLLFGAAAVLAGGAAWAAYGSATGHHRAAPQPPPGPGPTGPAARWTYHGTGTLQLDRLDQRVPHPPLYPAGGHLVQLDPDRGTERRRFTVPFSGPLTVAGSLVLAGDEPDQGVQRGLITGYDLDSGSTDWQYALPSATASPTSGATPSTLRGLETSTVQVLGCDGEAVYCLVDLVTPGGPGGPGAGPSGPGGRNAAPDEVRSSLLALSLGTRQVIWQQAVADTDTVAMVAPVPGGRLLVGGVDTLSLLDASTGNRLWRVVAKGWCVADDQQLYLSDGNGGLRVLSLADGSARWTAVPDPGASWRFLPPLAGAGKVFLFTEDGLVRAVDPTSAVRWSVGLPFRLDLRSRPLLLGDLLLVPGPADAGVVALDAATGAARWTFRDTEPGVDVWSVSTDGRRCYLGHDQVLHCVDPSAG
ncbi:PQQ-binding-like beta-propeller repeat protein [Kitasatospora sp. LaBMicrA B282]|uniref:outer membrane protein assembly factor BamB family protein n=1 Tax=Kitasatospora sp. LaBMicrA B282 TaxID=3420949 RepID=UPI003D0E0C57